ncbi:winged helix-turn-helix transcriptional regulator [Barnesiella viscericola]|uniref:winged helix-turn-helix transcriptional regulator n=1 Tax=Barnesiella viscericola TaxID=397865 RepID=UPI0024B78120|nr:helix-turn-helix domain-containing protein [Barnesiella viscericola]
MKTFLHTGVCPVRDILSRLGSKWSVLVLETLHENGTMRFNDIQRSLGDISQRMLTVTLRSLEEDGMLTRRVYAEIPPRVEYTLTERGQSFMPVLSQVVGWAFEHADDILASRAEARADRS